MSEIEKLKMQNRILAKLAEGYKDSLEYKVGKAVVELIQQMIDKQGVDDE